jgi:hypothetical protein
MLRVPILIVSLSAIAPFTSQAANIVYQNDFQSAAGPEWSNTNLSVTPVGSRQFLGILTQGTTTLTLNGIANNQAVGVSFDLFIIGTWDGSQLIDPLSDPVHTVGPDVWSFAADGGAPLLSTTFSVFDGTKAMHSFRSYPQAYPGNYPADSFPARTGAAENDTLGYFEGDSVYHFSFNLVHTSGPLVLNFTGTFPVVDTESWGIDNVLVSVPEPSSIVLAALGLGGLAAWGWRRRSGKRLTH